jgi:NADPH-dependent 2,4-dienoyl-CoA reductase/sulfur reductase-like enzyme
MTPRIVVVGADAAGASAASTIKRRQPDWDVVVLEKSQDTSYAACGLPYWVAGQVATRSDLIARPRRSTAPTDSILWVEVTVSTWRRPGHLPARGQEESQPYDTLVIATGATPVRPPIPGITAPNVGRSIPWTAPRRSSRGSTDPAAGGGQRSGGRPLRRDRMAEAFLDRDRR